MLLSGLLAACGGGGNTASEAASAGAQAACEPKASVRIQMFGDSTQELQGTGLQEWMDGRFGPGVVAVTNHGVSGSTAADFPANLVELGTVTVVNYGANDLRQPNANVEVYKQRLRAMAPSYFETPNPTFDGYAQPMRDVAAELGRPVIDVSIAFRAQPNWRALVPDEVHPTWSALLWITYQVVGPALANEVDRQLCTAALDAKGRGPGAVVRASTPQFIVWGQSQGAMASTRVTYTNGGSQPATLALSGLSPPYRLSSNTCIAPAFGGICSVTITLETTGPVGGQGTQVLTATGAGNGPISSYVWGMLTPAN